MAPFPTKPSSSSPPSPSSPSSLSPFPFQTHRYVRSRLVEDNPLDQYDLKRSINAYNSSSNITSSGSSVAASSPSLREYWTNGRTTHLYSVPSVIIPTSQSTLQRPTPPRSSNNMSSSTATKAPAHKIMPSSHHSPPKNAFTRSPIQKNQHVVYHSLLAGSAAGMASTLACHPFDVLRVKMQSAGMTTAAGSAAATAATAATCTASGGFTNAASAGAATPATATAATQASTTTGVVGAIRSTLQFGGARALYTGLALPLAAQAVYKGTVFTVNNVTETAIVDFKTRENQKLGITQQPYRLTLADRFISGFLGGAVNAALFCTPVEFVRNQQIAQISNNHSHNNRGRRVVIGPFSVIQRTLQSHGVRGLWRGALTTVLRDSVGCGFFFVAMAYSQEALSQQQHHSKGRESSDGTGSAAADRSTSVIILSGAVAGVAYWLWALPVDTLKTWIQSGTAADLPSAWQLARDQGGRSSLFRGWQVAYTRGAPSAAITVTTYSLVYRQLQRRDEEQ